MKATFLKAILALAMFAGCSAAPLDTPSELLPPSDAVDTEQTAEELAALTAPSQTPAQLLIAQAKARRTLGIPANYALMPGGKMVHTDCIRKVAPGTRIARTTTPCVTKSGAPSSLQPNTIKKTMPIEGNTLTVTPSYSFSVPSGWVAAMMTGYRANTPQTNQADEYNITDFTSTTRVPVGAQAGDWGQLVIYSSGPMSWGGIWPAFDQVYAQARTVLQYGNNGSFGGYWWSLYQYVEADGYGYWSSPSYPDPDAGITMTGTSQIVADPYWGQVKRWTLTTQPSGQTATLDVQYDLGFNFLANTLEYYGTQQRNLYPASDYYGFNNSYMSAPKGCATGSVPWWFCTPGTSPFKWRVVGNGGSMPDYFIQQGPSSIGISGTTFHIVPR